VGSDELDRIAAGDRSRRRDAGVGPDVLVEVTDDVAQDGLIARGRRVNATLQSKALEQLRQQLAMMGLHGTQASYLQPTPHEQSRALEQLQQQRAMMHLQDTQASCPRPKPHEQWRRAETAEHRIQQQHKSNQ
jgi:hypothetical protein